MLPHGGRDPPARMCGLMRSCGVFRRYCRHGRGRIRRGKRSMEYAFILGRMYRVCLSAAHILFFLLYYTTISCVCKSNYRFLYQYIVFSGVVKRPPHHILYLIACIKGFFCSSLLAPKVCIRHASSDLAPPPCSAVFSYHRLV